MSCETNYYFSHLKKNSSHKIVCFVIFRVCQKLTDIDFSHKFSLKFERLFTLVLFLTPTYKILVKGT